MATPAPAARPYPIALALAGRRCVVVGGGAVAERKARGLLAAGAAVTVIAPRLAPGLRALADAGALTIAERPYAPGDLAGACLACAATDRREINAAVAAEARAAGALVNVADAPAEGDFTLPAVARRGGLTLAISTDGESPLVASLVRDRLADCLDGYAALLDVVAAVRAEARAAGR
ncbi:MAG TPA: bifunctional precorrin-2 dehydrogenase/sirohydrochlorin ferrochelatase, partial [Thermomicrobiales bacterium]|nr:bifunctional precorrin-2 dehydrogenase/sirohydrochlorin ferrochelatase [Thermomicrobiales bacterium]